MATSINADNGAVSGSAGLKSTADSSGVLALQTNGTTAITVDASQVVSIGTTNVGGTLNTTTTSGNWGEIIYDLANNASMLAFRNASGAAAGNISLSSAGATSLLISSVAGVNFPATQVASANANTLDDYEEGTWSPTVEGTTTAGTVTYASRSGKYTKVGNVVTFSAYIGWSSGSGTGNLQIAGFPFAPTGTTYPAITTIANDLTLTALNIAVAYISDGTTAALIQQCPTGGGAKTNVVYDAAVSELFLAGVYQTAT